MTQGDNLIISMLTNSQQLGFYVMAYQLAVFPVLFLQVIGSKDGLTILAEGVEWKRDYNEPSTDAWHDDVGYDDSSWTIGTTPYSNKGPVTTTLYYRKVFTSPDFAGRNYTDLTFTLEVDDGAAVYFNGKLVHAQNISTLYHNSPAPIEISGTAEVMEFSVPSSMLIDGENLVAVEVHQHNPEQDDDLYFSLEIKATLTEVVIPFGSRWNYYDEVDTPPVDGNTKQWRELGYTKDSNWDLADAPFGYVLDDPPINPRNLNPDSAAIYFRKTFSVDPAEYDSLTARLLYDDGAVFYSNGVEDPTAHRLNMPDEGGIEYDTCPLAVRRASEESQYSE
ncbi:MAG: hypothetical protein D3924_20820, partial [Candidatus Electrothrix sp. AR4]|nr:hypothetical protein [Candidatus Electrothrix sp. AR4]